MFETALNLHNPRDKRSHSILRFFSEDLTEGEKIEFVRAIFNRGSWTLSTEISRSSNSDELNLETKNILKQILEDWVQKRIEHSKSRLTSETKNPYVPKKYSYEFREAIIAIKDLNFHEDLLLIIEKFIDGCHPAYLDKFVNRAFWLAIDEFNTKELEAFFLHFSRLYIKNDSENIGHFLYVFLRNLAYSTKIFFISESFSTSLVELSQKIKAFDDYKNYSSLISVLLIDFIRLKELDLSKAEYNRMILPTMNRLEKGNLDNLELFSFLNKFNYEFKGYNFKEDIDSLLYSIEVNLNKIKGDLESTKKAILHHFVKSSDEYLELLVFQLGFLEEPSRHIELKRFINLIDRLRTSFMEVMWFKEYDNFVPIKGSILSALPDGFGVELDTCYISEFLKRKNFPELEKDEFIKENLVGFANKKTFKKNTDLNEFHTYLENNKEKKNYKNANAESISQINLFQISGVNYSSSNKGSVLNLMPFSESIYNLVYGYRIKSFFSCVDIFLANEACDLLEVVSPFGSRQNSQIFSRMLPSLLKPQIKLDLNQDEFWKILEFHRPHIFHETFIKIRDNQKRFKKLTEIYEEDKIVQGIIQSTTKGGFYVIIEGYQTFLPGSQIQHYGTPDYDSYINKTMEFKIVKIYHEYKSVVISHIAVNEEENSNKRKNLISKLKKGLILTGIAKNITSYGVFIDLGGIDGLIYISDLSWSRVEHPSDVVSLGEEIQVIVIDFDLENNKIELGLKQLKPHPWDSVSSKIFKGNTVKGKISKLLNAGAIIEILPGVEGLAHISNISNTLYSRLKVGEEILVKVIFVDPSKKKLRFSLNFTERTYSSRDNFLEFVKKLRVGDILDGIVVKKNNGTGIIKIEPSNTIAAICPSRHMKNKNGELAEIRDKTKFKLLEIDKTKSRLIVSHTVTLKPRS
jgi:small subunit ribosomal protein S1